MAIQTPSEERAYVNLKNQDFATAYGTDAGRSRKGNQDNYAVFDARQEIPAADPPLMLPVRVAVVADGGGGADIGEMASLIAVDTFVRQFGRDQHAVIHERLESSLLYANRKIFLKAKDEPKYKGMGTTIVVAAIVDKKYLYIAHAGDCRAYLIRNGKIHQLTLDHTFAQEARDGGDLTIEEAKKHLKRNVVKRYLGPVDKVEVDHEIVEPVESAEGDNLGRKRQMAAKNRIEMLANDTLLLCTDGLTNVVSDENILAGISRFDPQKAVDELIKAANSAGGPDNVTIVVLQKVGKGEFATSDAAAASARAISVDPSAPTVPPGELSSNLIQNDTPTVQYRPADQDPTTIDLRTSEPGYFDEDESGEATQPLIDVDEAHAQDEIVPLSESAKTHFNLRPKADEHPHSPMQVIVWQNLVARSAPQTDWFTTHTLDVHVLPTFQAQIEQTEGIDSADEKLFKVLLTYRETQNSQAQPVTYYEGDLQVDLRRAPLGRAYGAALHRSLFHASLPTNQGRLLKGEAGRLSLKSGYQRALGRAEGGDGLRLQLRIDNAVAELHKLKWEYLWDTEGVGGGPLACSDNTPFARVLHVEGPVGEPIPQIDGDEKIRVLLALSSPTAWERLGEMSEHFGPLSQLADIDRTLLTELQRDLQTYAFVDSIEGAHLLDSDEQPVSLDLIRQRLLDARLDKRPYHVLHLICHGVVQDGDERAFLALQEDKTGAAELIAEQLFADAMAQFVPDGLRLIVLASCHTAAVTDKHALQGVARRLVAAGVPAVVAMQGRLEFGAAQHFSQRFYATLFHTGEVDRAANAGRRRLFELEHDRAQSAGDNANTTTGSNNNGTQVSVGRRQWGVPVLFMRLPDGKLFEIEDGVREQVDPLTPTLAVEQPQISENSRQELAQNLLQNFGTSYGIPMVVPMTTPMTTPVSISTTVPASVHTGPPQTALNGAAATGSIHVQPEEDLPPLQSDLSELQSLKLTAHIEDLPIIVDQSIIARAVAALNAGKHIIFHGPPGTGKTTLAEAICRLAREQSYSMGHMLSTATSEWTTFDTVGGYVPAVNGALTFQPGVFLDAINSGQWLIIDEINRADIDKAFGELFSVLSGQSVTLPFRYSNDRVRILSKDSDDAMVTGADCIVHPNWRIIGTMNVFDKASLFRMSYAFMRRFAFIQVGVPVPYAYYTLLWQMLTDVGFGPPSEPTIVDDALSPLEADHNHCTEMLHRLFKAEAQNYVMAYRTLGPAIAGDIVGYLRQRATQSTNGFYTQPAHLVESIMLYVVPQFDNLEHSIILAIYRQLSQLFAAKEVLAELTELQNEIRMMYPYIQEEEWQNAS